VASDHLNYREVVLKVSKKLKESRQEGWTTKQVNEMMIVKEGRKEGGGIQYHSADFLRAILYN
jgi:hypothetical protein